MLKSIISYLLLIFPAALFAVENDSSGTAFRVRDGFHVEHVYSVPRGTQGSWVALAVDPRGRLIASDQNGGLYRIDPTMDDPLAADRIDLPIGHAHGLRCAFGSLYAVVADEAYQGPGLYRIRDTNGDDQYDSVELLTKIEGKGEHGPHSVVVSPDKSSLFVVAGNKTRVPEAALKNSLVPLGWGEDDLLPRLWGPVGSEAGTPAPGGWIASTDPDGKTWKLHAIGLRNSFDMAFNQRGDLFTVDADAEFDLGTPWYQPTRVFHVVDGTDFGWRSGAGKWPPHFADTLPPVVELGPGSPTGIVFGYGSSFPPRYQKALFVGDWSRGRLLAVHTNAVGAGYEAGVEEIVSGMPLPITDIVAHPDGGLYFTIGGRGTTSGIFRLSSTIMPPENNSLSSSKPALLAPLQNLRDELIALYRSPSPEIAVGGTWANLDHADRTIRHVARLVLEHTSCDEWRQQALSEPTPLARMTALLALARTCDPVLLPDILDSLIELDWDTLGLTERQTHLRCIEVALIRFGAFPLDPQVRKKLLDFLSPKVPSKNHLLDVALLKLLVFLESPAVPRLALAMIDEAVTPQTRLDYMVLLRHQQSGWTVEQRQEYFQWLNSATAWRGGISLSKYVSKVAADALESTPDDDRQRFAALMRSRQNVRSQVEAVRPVVREWTLAELLENFPGTEKPGDAAAGRRVFADAKCFACHRFHGEGGAVGPDLTSIARRFNRRDLLESLVEPNRVISDQFSATSILTIDGQLHTGLIVNLQQDTIQLQTNMFAPSDLVRIEKDQIETMRASTTSMMPTGLLDTFTRQEISDLLAYLAAQETQ